MTKNKITKSELFGSLSFKTLRTNPDFKEDSVREVIILPILQALGYTNDAIKKKIFNFKNLNLTE
ncbi:MAG: hypothetical protein OXH57_00505 [Ekhidna sp.]|nr:hypothetical protein [Ekhidna sp.]